MRKDTAIFLCDCGRSLKNIDFELVRKRLEESQQAAYVGLSSGLCLEEGLQQMISAIRGNGITRAVVAACSPLQKETVFRTALQEAGLNSNALVIANIREQCSWSHDADVTEKALELITMAVSRAQLLRETETIETDVVREVLVVGGGASGMESALRISRLGLKATLLEREATLGGNGFPFARLSRGEAIASMVKAVQEDEHIEVFTGASLTKVEGHVGNFSVRIRIREQELRRTFGAIVFATGRMPDGLPAEFSQTPAILSQQELAAMLQAPEKLTQRPETVAFALDLSGEDARGSTLWALNHALAVKQRLGSEVYVLCKDLKVDSQGAEALYRHARDEGVVFLKFEDKPILEPNEDGGVSLAVRDLLWGSEVKLSCDFVVIEGKSLPSEGTEALSAALKLGTDSRGRYQDENVHLYPVSSRRKGIFFVGSCHNDLDLDRTQAEISSAAAKVYELLSTGKVTLEVEKVKAEPDRCRACLTCIRVCPHSAIRLVRTDEGAEVAQICDLACDECGICAAICPAKAIEGSRFGDEHVLAQIQALGQGRVLVFCCAESAYRAADRAGKLGIHYPSQIRVIQVPCVGRVDLLYILKAFERGAAGVLVMGCPEGSCQHLEGNIRAKQRVTYAQSLLGEMGMDPEKVKFVGLGPDMAVRFAEEVTEMSARTERKMI